jgi:hypothetical protein
MCKDVPLECAIREVDTDHHFLLAYVQRQLVRPRERTNATRKRTKNENEKDDEGGGGKTHLRGGVGLGVGAEGAEGGRGAVCMRTGGS